jgi:hypothetical protein
LQGAYTSRITDYGLRFTAINQQPNTTNQSYV